MGTLDSKLKIQSTDLGHPRLKTESSLPPGLPTPSNRNTKTLLSSSNRPLLQKLVPAQDWSSYIPHLPAAQHEAMKTSEHLLCPLIYFEPALSALRFYIRHSYTPHLV